MPSPYIRPLLDRHLPQASKLPPLCTPPTLLMGQLLYGTALDSVRPVEDVARIVPRPMLLIHETGDNYPGNSGSRARTVSYSSIGHGRGIASLSLARGSWSAASTHGPP